jgi:hypothetical protein
MMRRALVMGCAGLALAAPVAAVAAGGPVPPEQGGASASAPGSGVDYAVYGAGVSDTLVKRVLRADGRVQRSARLAGSFGIPAAAYDNTTTGASADGRTLVLAGMLNNNNSVYPPTHTRLIVLDGERLSVRERVTLPGYYAVDAVSPNGRWLYLIHQASTTDLTRYEVRAYDLAARRLLPAPVIDPRERGKPMQGMPVTRAVSADGRWAYTLYQGNSGPFIHALDTQRRAAVCVDLPAMVGANFSGLKLTLAGGMLTVGRDGRPLALVDTRTFAITRPGVRSQASPARHAAAARHGGGASGLPWLLVAIPILVFVAFRQRKRRRGRLAEPVTVARERA